MAESVTAGGECGVCRVGVKDSDKALSCDVCKKWNHIKCVDVSIKQYEVIAKFDGKSSGLHWYCNQCNAIATKTIEGLGNMGERQDRLEAEVLGMKSDLGELLKEMSEIKGKMTGGIPTLAQIVASGTGSVEGGIGGGRVVKEVNGGIDRDMQVQMREVLERDKRKENLIIMGVAEDEKEDLGKEIVDTIVKDLMEGEFVRLEFLGRVGVKGQKVRPIRIKIESAEMRRKLLSRGKLLKEKKDWEKVFIAPDLTRMQQDKDRLLREKLRGIRGQGETSAKIVKGQIVKFVDGVMVVLERAEE
jgi:PHD-finger